MRSVIGIAVDVVINISIIFSFATVSGRIKPVSISRLTFHSNFPSSAESLRRRREGFLVVVVVVGGVVEVVVVGVVVVGVVVDEVVVEGVVATKM
jgi:hypothetical protein